MIKGNRRENGQRGREEGRVRKSRKEIKREREVRGWGEREKERERWTSSSKFKMDRRNIGLTQAYLHSREGV